MKYKKIGVMCGSSEICDDKFLNMSYQLGQELAKNNHDVVYGGGAKGLMRRVADGCLDNGGKAYGYIPEFMIEVEWQHKGLTELIITKDMSERKELLMKNSDATIFLPGGCGTMEEFFVWLSAKRLGQHLGPLIIFNQDGYYDPLLKLLENMEEEKFHNPHHKKMWNVCSKVEEVSQVLEDAHPWTEEAIHTASASHDEHE